MHNSLPVPSPDLSPTGVGGRGGGLSRLRVCKALEGREPDRVPVFNILSGEDAPVRAADAPRVAPDSDLSLVFADLTPRYPERILERDGDTVVRTTSHGGVCRLTAGSRGPAEILDYPVKSRADWEIVSRRLAVEPDRVDRASMAPTLAGAAEQGLCIALAAPAGFRACAAYLGVSALLDCVGGDPGLVSDIAGAHAALLTGVAELLLTGGCPFDAVLLLDDLANSRGLRVTPAGFRRTLAPALRRLIDFFHAHEIRVLYYAGGDLRLLVPDLIDTGLDCLGPLDAAAGMDLPILKINYGADLAFLGGIDRRALSYPDPAGLEREIATVVRAGMVNGRYITGFDGPLPAGLPAERLALAAALLAQYGKY